MNPRVAQHILPHKSVSPLFALAQACLGSESSQTPNSLCFPIALPQGLSFPLTVPSYRLQVVE